MDLPNLIIAGVNKAGTTSLFTYLAAHPDIHPARVKEVNYFTPLLSGEPIEDLAVYAGSVAGHGEERYRLEASPFYMFGTDTIVPAMSATLDSPKILIVLREPVARFRSFWRFGVTQFYLPPDETLEAFVARALAFRDEPTPPGRYANNRYDWRAYWSLWGGCYARFLPAWMERFEERVRLVFFEDLVGDPKRALTELCAWLGLPDTVYETYEFSRENASTGYKWRGLQRIALRTYGRFEPVLRARPGLKKLLRRGYYGVNGQKVAASSEEDTLPLQAFYAAYNEELSEQLNTWGYSRPSWLE